MALIYEWDRYNELRAILSYLIKAETTAHTPQDFTVIHEIEAMIVARLSYIPVNRRLK